MDDLNHYDTFMYVLISSIVIIATMLYAPAELDIYFVSIGLLMCIIVLSMCVIDMFRELKRRRYNK